MAATASNATVLIVIVNYNGGDIVMECAASCLSQTYPFCSVVVVDNGSSDGSADALATAHPGVAVVKNGYNAGWAGGCNTGIAFSDSRYVAVVNSDAVLDRECIAAMVSAIESFPRAGSCASKIMLYDRRGTIEACGLSIAADGSACARGRLSPAERFSNTEEVFCASDCCCLYKREMLADIGPYDEDFFMYCNDTDIGFRQQLAGWKCVFTPQARAYHIHSKAAGSYSPFKAFYVERNRICVVLKSFPVSAITAAFFGSMTRYCLQVWLSLAKKRGALSRFRDNYSFFTGLTILIKAHCSALWMAPSMMKKRRSIVSRRRIGPMEFKQLFSRFAISLREMAAYE
ncbi:MAG TPA: glycosyltransferase family 2 protein [Chitinivibrionales bacterium]|nr:glycosyltransferase family 2 protein [Chitinivibrionales bacterium]